MIQQQQMKMWERAQSSSGQLLLDDTETCLVAIGSGALGFGASSQSHFLNCCQVDHLGRAKSSHNPAAANAQPANSPVQQNLPMRLQLCRRDSCRRSPALIADSSSLRPPSINLSTNCLLVSMSKVLSFKCRMPPLLLLRGAKCCVLCYAMLCCPLLAWWAFTWPCLASLCPCMRSGSDTHPHTVRAEAPLTTALQVC
jgi:hypothetical protein